MTLKDALKVVKFDDAIVLRNGKMRGREIGRYEYSYQIPKECMNWEVTSITSGFDTASYLPWDGYMNTLVVITVEDT